MSKEMKIAIFHNLPSGGAKRALFGFVKYLKSKNHLIDVHVPESANETFLPLESLGAKVKIYPIKKTFKGVLYSRFYAPFDKHEVPLHDLEMTEKTIAYAIDSKDYDIVICEQDQYTMAPFFLKYIKKPTVYYCQQPLRKNEVISKRAYAMLEKKEKKFKDRFFNYIHDRVEKIDIEIDTENAYHAKHILANSFFSHESILRAYGLNSFVSYLGIDINLFKPLKLPKSDFVLSVGSCNPTKGYDFIIRSLSLINPEIRPKFKIVSNAVDSVWESYLKELANKLDVDLEILHLVDDLKLVELYNTAKLVVYAPYLEPFGLVPIESMACQTPVIAVREGGIRETVIHNETGILTERDETSFANALTVTLGDEEKINEMSVKSLEIVRKFWTLDHAGERLEKHLIKYIQ